MERVILGLTIPAKLCSDDFAKYAEFDAKAWFASAPLESILKLAHSGWCGECAADVARDPAVENDAVADVLQYAMYLRHGGLRGDTKCSIDAVAALEWLAYHRPEVLAALRGNEHIRVFRT